MEEPSVKTQFLVRIRVEVGLVVVDGAEDRGLGLREPFADNLIAQHDYKVMVFGDKLLADLDPFDIFVLLRPIFFTVGGIGLARTFLYGSLCSSDLNIVKRSWVIIADRVKQPHRRTLQIRNATRKIFAAILFLESTFETDLAWHILHAFDRSRRFVFHRTQSLQNPILQPETPIR